MARAAARRLLRGRHARRRWPRRGAPRERTGRCGCSALIATRTPSSWRASALARFGDRVSFVEADFGDLEDVLAGRPDPDGILADLGVSSMQIDQAERGFSFRRDGPLDMRMGQSGPSAADLVATASVEELTRIFRDFGEERMAAKIARGIVAERTRGPIATTRQLARIVAGEKGSREKIDPATRVFQALRIEVNQELVALGSFLAAAVARTEGRRPARGHLVPLPRRPHRQGDVSPRVGRVPVPAADACLRLRRPDGAEGPDAAPDPALGGRRAPQPEIAQRAAARGREDRARHDAGRTGGAGRMSPGA